jgi:hypothetical protein
LGVDLLAVSLGERVAEEPLVFRQDLRVSVVAEVLEERGGPLDVVKRKVTVPVGRLATRGLILGKTGRNF